jgi:hypothetical protein
MTATRRTAAPPMATPAIPPVLSLSGLLDTVAAVGDVGPPVALGVASLVAKDVTVVGLLLLSPPAVRLT